jgi:hypothetical protein
LYDCADQLHDRGIGLTAVKIDDGVFLNEAAPEPVFELLA